MFPYEEYVTLLSAIALVASGYIVYTRYNKLAGLLWLVGSLSFLVVVLALIVKGLDALKLSITPILGSVYPAFIAAAIVSSYSRHGLYYVVFALVMLALILVGVVIEIDVLKGVSHGILHSVSGLVIVLLPLYYYFKERKNSWPLVISLGGIVISIGGIALAAIAMGREILPLDLVIYILHPVLFLSALLLAAGFYYSKGLSG